MSQAPVARDAALVRWRNASFLAGAAAAAVCALGAVFNPAPFFRAYLAAHVFFLGVALGGMAILMIHHLTGGAWGYLVRRILEAQTKTLPLLAALFIPVAFGVRDLYPWAQPESVAHDALLQRQQFYLNAPFWWGRAALCFALWLLLAWRLNALSRRQETSGDPHLPRKLQRFSEAGLVLFGTSMHFAAFDWIEMLQPSFHSTIFPLLVIAGQLVSALAFALIVFRRVSAWPATSEAFSRQASNDLGNLLLTFLVIWAYLEWFQYMLIWIANLPTEALWYLPRLRGAWLWVARALVLLHFAVPLFLLLLRDVKQRPAALARVAALIFGMQLVFDVWQVLPAFPVESLAQHWIDFCAPCAIGGLWLANFLWALGRAPAPVRNDPNRAGALQLRRIDEEESQREEALAHV